ncbi:hypothetical protein [Corynebacterium sp. HS2168-gen11]|uniref:hypothetical protein n=1 Tax=Corynebacterium sp. HS2168-gen11 TaxID=2974027 RepID=UPI00216AD45E|nr:hypothetical protein [Corynebacterium sp. HS2168-gen11]MCS4535933.1 hypothetical protein [Corynebacterium sp. HS2168-gen11]
MNLRDAGATSSASIARAAVIMAQIEKQKVSQEASLSAWSVLAPHSREQTARLFRRAPMQLIARLDVLLGGNGQPAGPAQAKRLMALGREIQQQRVSDAALVVMVHYEIAQGNLLGEQRSRNIGAICGRIAAMATGFDPKNLCVPEIYIPRHAQEYAACMDNYEPEMFSDFWLAAMRAGAQEARGIAQVVGLS